MIVFPNAKINLGLAIERRRPDGYHDISTVMVPVDWCDVLEIVPAGDGVTELVTYGRSVDCPPEKNLVMKAYNALSAITGGLPATKFYLKKIIPDGAGMGGGSADAAFSIKALNDVFNLGLPDEVLAQVAATVGADCPFFIYNRPMYCTGTGTEMQPCDVPQLAKKAILIAKPRVASVSTREAYAGVTPALPDYDLRSLMDKAPSSWRGKLSNDFEKSIFDKLPAVLNVKKIMEASGVEYASMTGSGAAVYGIFGGDKMAHDAALRLDGCDVRVCHML